LQDSTSLISLEGLNPTALTSSSLGHLPKISSLAELTVLQCLHELHVSPDLRITSLEPLSQLPNLQSLIIDNGEQVPSLAGVSITHLGLVDVDSLAGTQSLASCLKSLSCNRLQNLQGVQELTGLQKVELERGMFTSLQPLAVLQHLRELKVNGCSKVVEHGGILMLPHFPSTGSISMSGSRVTDVGLAGGVHREVSTECPWGLGWLRPGHPFWD
jgi:hypothetical protein